MLTLAGPEVWSALATVVSAGDKKELMTMAKMPIKAGNNFCAFIFCTSFSKEPYVVISTREAGRNLCSIRRRFPLAPSARTGVSRVRTLLRNPAPAVLGRCDILRQLVVYTYKGG